MFESFVEVRLDIHVLADLGQVVSFQFVLQVLLVDIAVVYLTLVLHFLQ